MQKATQPPRSRPRQRCAKQAAPARCAPPEPRGALSLLLLSVCAVVSLSDAAQVKPVDISVHMLLARAAAGPAALGTPFAGASEACGYGYRGAPSP